eukprot:2346114-Rhodomonas_salina.1
MDELEGRSSYMKQVRVRGSGISGRTLVCWGGRWRGLRWAAWSGSVGPRERDGCGGESVWSRAIERESVGRG